MTKNTYAKLMEMGKEYLVGFIMKMENIPSINLQYGKDLSVEDISKIEDLYTYSKNN